ncbi:hypothetical protein TCAP_06292 [Tolypocladium capitatum]|uniref:Uncharacterized protein n=1 Tax=Tolypocladium capitatum TaxID=45235 RepID=A0A2K3Q8D6_9HYPO|nr:hypothetical protein TCAP_06292 [Tolypocladium capitatum]
MALHQDSTIQPNQAPYRIHTEFITFPSSFHLPVYIMNLSLAHLLVGMMLSNPVLVAGLACGVNFTFCSSLGMTTCACDRGDQLLCTYVHQDTPAPGFALWMKIRECPKKPGRLQCIDGQCT